MRAWAIGLAMAASVTMAHADPAGSLCRAPETVLFTCRIGAKTVSICGGTAAGATYRYGRAGRVESELTGLHRASVGYAGGGETQVYADTPTHRFVVYDRMVGIGRDPEGHTQSTMTQGLRVQRGAHMLSDRHCTDPLPPAFDQRGIEALIPPGDPVPR